MKKMLLAAALGTGALIAAAGVALTDTQEWDDRYIGAEEGIRSGYTYRTEETRALQDDEFLNPGFLWVEIGEELWNTVDGEAGKSCASCHEDAAESMGTVATRYPIYDDQTEGLINTELKINRCREENMQAEPWKYESEELLGMTTFIHHQAEGKEINVDITGPAEPFYLAGEEYYNTRRGQLDMACSHCHEDHSGSYIRADLLSSGMANGFPTYRLKWQGVGSLHRRFRGCNDQVRAERQSYGADDYLNVELYLKHRGRGLTVETPAVRQ